MKRITLLAIILSGCMPEPKPFPGERILHHTGNGGVAIIEVDGCEYVFVKHGYGGGLAHKGNCKNHEHIPKQ